MGHIEGRAIKWKYSYKESGETKATVVLRLDSARRMMSIWSLETKPQYRRMGLAMRLVNICQQRAAAMGVDVWLRVAVNNTPAIRLYTKMGFKLGGVSGKDKPGHIIMIWRHAQ